MLMKPLLDLLKVILLRLEGHLHADNVDALK